MIKAQSNLSAVQNRTKIKAVLAGNPNCGKTTLFNQLTGSRQHVGNWPGVTVEKKSGTVRCSQGAELEITDLPGVYSLSPCTPEEAAALDCLLNDSPDIIINIADATNLERNLYLTTQLAELGIPMVIALNMFDIFEKSGDKIDTAQMQSLLGIPVVPISASKNSGIDKLVETAVLLYQNKINIRPPKIYSAEIERTLEAIEKVTCGSARNSFKFGRHTAVKLFEGDKKTWDKAKLPLSQRKQILLHINKIRTDDGIDRAMRIADERYGFICGVIQSAVKRKHPADRTSISDRIDGIVTHRFFALPVFLIIMLSVFGVTFGAPGVFLRDKAEYFISDVLGGALRSLMIAANTAEWAQSLVIDGIISGVGSVISFLPQIALLFTLLSLLEDSGYMSRAAFIADKLLRRIGLSGRAFVPMLMGFGCTVPAVLATRTLENRREKQLAVLLAPFMSCSAKMPVYMLFISYFLADRGPLIIFLIYLTGIIAAIFTACLFRGNVLKGENTRFILEMPPYRVPSPKNIARQVWNRLRDFLVRAGTVLLFASVIIWFLQSYGFSLQPSPPDESILAAAGKLIAPVFSVCGFGDWRASVALVSGIAAKESIASVLSVLYSSASLADSFSALSAFSYMIFVLLCPPCIAAVSAIYKELSSAKLTAISVIYQIFIAWLCSALVYQTGTLITNLTVL